MAPPRGRRGRERARGRQSGGNKRRLGFNERSTRDRKGRAVPPRTDPEDQKVYDDVERFHVQKDKINFDEGNSDSEDLSESEQEEAVMSLAGAGQDDSGSVSDSDDSDDGSEASELPELPEHVRRAAMKAVSSDDDSDEDAERGGKFAAGWGKSRSSYYNADTADLEIGQEFEDAEAEEEAALELQKASYKQLDLADFGDQEVNGEDGTEAASTRQTSRGNHVAPNGKTARGAAMLAMKTDLEQIALGAGEEVETSVIRRDTSKLSRRDKLELVLSDAPELPSILAEVRAQLKTLRQTVQPLVANVTADLGASEDGLAYLRTRQQLLLAYCMNVCFCMVLKAKGEPAKGHPVMRRLVSLRTLLGEMALLDDKMLSQVTLLLRALESGVDLANAGASDGDDDEDVRSEVMSGEMESGLHGDHTVRIGGSTGGKEESTHVVDEEGLEEEEARFMGTGSVSSDDEGHGSLPLTSEKRLLAEKREAKAAARVKARVMGLNGDSALDDFGDDELAEGEGFSTKSGGSGVNLLQGMVNRISQREKISLRKRRGLHGDLDVPVRERDQTIRVRRPVPGESDGDSATGAGGADSDADDLGFRGGAGAGGDFLEGLPASLLEGLSRRKGDAGAKQRDKGNKGRKRYHDEDGDEAANEQDSASEYTFYAAVEAEKKRKKMAKRVKYHPEARIAGALEAELEEERAARGETKRGASYTIIKNRGLTPHKNKLNRNPRSKKREAFRKATIRRKGQVRDVREGEADRYGGESTGIKSNVTRSRKLKG